MDTADVSDRSSSRTTIVTDKISLVVFCVSLIIYISISLLVIFVYGHKPSVQYPVDSFGNRCGVGHLKEKPYLLYFNFDRCALNAFGPFRCRSSQMCVSSCPNFTISFDKIQHALMTGNESIKSLIPCSYKVLSNSLTSTTFLRLASDGQCAKSIRKSMPILNRCIPLSIIQLEGLRKIESTIQVLAGSKKWLIEHFKDDIIQISWMTAVFVYLSILLSLLCLALTTYLARPVAWSCIFLSCGTMFASGLLIFYISLSEKDLKSFVSGFLPSGISAYPLLSSSIGRILASKYLWIVAGSFCLLFATIMLGVVTLFYRQIDRASLLVGEAAYSISRVPSTVVWPFFEILTLLVFTFFYLLICMYFRTVHLPSFTEQGHSTQIFSSTNKTTFHPTAIHASTIRRFPIGQIWIQVSAWIFMILSIWYLLYILAIEKLTYVRLFLMNSQTPSGRIPDYQKIPFVQLFICFALSIVLNSGTAAIGSVLILLTFLLSTICTLGIAVKQISNRTLPDFMKNISIPFDWISRMTRPISSTAYVLVVKDGINFRTACSDMFNYLEERNSEYIVTQVFLSLTMLFISTFGVFATGSIGILLLQLINDAYFFKRATKLNSSQQKMSRKSLTLAIFSLCTLIGIFVCYAIVSAYRAAVDVLLVCFLQKLDEIDEDDHERVMGNDRTYKLAKKQKLLPRSPKQTKPSSELTNQNSEEKIQPNVVSDENVASPIDQQQEQSKGDDSKDKDESVSSTSEKVEKQAQPAQPSQKKYGMRWRRK